MWQRMVPMIATRLFGDTPLPLRIQVQQRPPLALGPSPRVLLKINTFKGFLALLFPSLGRFARHYVQGHIDLEGDLEQIMRVGETLCERDGYLSRVLARLPRLPHKPGPTGAKQVQYHYDASNAFYALWLDRQMVYSGAYFKSPDDTLEQAQQQKIEHICRKLRLQPGERLLDIGCGWGALLFHAVEHYGVSALGITLSRAQYDYVSQQIERRGLGDRCRAQLCDYRDLPPNETFNKIASVGMIEHVGEANLEVYFQKIYRLLAAGGLVLIQGITLGTYSANRQSRGLSDFMERHVFPGSQLSPVSKVVAVAEQAQLESLDLESLRRHYAQTLKCWSRRLDAHKEQAVELVGEEKYRTWRIYMGGCAYAFDRGWISLYQMLAGKPDGRSRIGAPWTRDDIYLAQAAGAPVADAIHGQPCDADEP